jgi:hypothetical protein
VLGAIKPKSLNRIVKLAKVTYTQGRRTLVLSCYEYTALNLDKLYLVYIRTFFEYYCKLWDNCGIGNSQKLEQLQLEAARIVKGLPIFTKTDFFKVFHLVIVEGIKESLVEDSLKKGRII